MKKAISIAVLVFVSLGTCGCTQVPKAALAPREIEVPDYHYPVVDTGHEDISVPSDTIDIEETTGTVAEPTSRHESTERTMPVFSSAEVYNTFDEVQPSIEGFTFPTNAYGDNIKCIDTCEFSRKFGDDTIIVTYDVYEYLSDETIGTLFVNDTGITMNFYGSYYCGHAVDYYFSVRSIRDTASFKVIPDGIDFTSYEVIASTDSH